MAITNKGWSPEPTADGKEKENGYDEYVATQNLLKAVDDIYLIATACLKKMGEPKKPHVLVATVSAGVKELSRMVTI